MSVLPGGPLTRTFEAGVIPAAAAPTTPSGSLPMGVFSAAPTALTERQASWFRLDASRQLMVAGSFTPTPPTPSSLALLNAPIEASGAGDNILIAAPGAGLRIYVFQLVFLTRNAVNVRLRSAATNLTGLLSYLTQGQFAVDGPGDRPIYALGVSEALIANLSAAVGIDGSIAYTVAA